MTSASEELKLFSPPASESAPNPKDAMYLSAAVASLALIAIASWLAWGKAPLLSFQPTMVGMLWGCIFLSGHWIGGLGRGRLAGLILAVPIVLGSLLAFHSLTEIGWPDSLLLTACLLLAGWGRTRFEVAGAGLATDEYGHAAHSPWLRCSIWDIGFLTTIAACLTHTWPRLETPPLLMLGISAAMLGGFLFSWIACHWVWNDHWSPVSLGVLLMSLVAGVAIVWLSAPPGLDMQHAVRWAITGPINVIAAQGLAVMAVMSVWRFDRFRSSTTHPANSGR